MNTHISSLFNQGGTPPSPPKTLATELVGLGGTRVDHYYWLRDLEDPDTMKYLVTENAYYESVSKPLQSLEDAIYEEIRARTKETDLSVAVPKGPYEYYARTQEALQYPIHCRRPRGGGDEEVILDENILAEGQEYLALGASSVSPDHRLLAYSLDFDGSESFELRIGAVGSALEEYTTILDTYYGLCWSEDSAYVFYTRADEAMRPYQIYRHHIGTTADADVLIFQEDDERFFLDVSKTSDDRYIVIDVQSKVTTEQWLVPADHPLEKPMLFVEREAGIEYSVDHHDLGYFVVTNLNRPDFRLLFAPDHARDTPWTEWKDFLSFDADERLEGVELFRSHLALLLRERGQLQLRLIDLASMQSHTLAQPELLGSIWPSVNAEFDTATFRYEYTSFSTPHTIFEVDLSDYSISLLKVQEVLGGYDPSAYVSEQLWIPSHDGVEVPVSIARRRDLDMSQAHPVLLYGYGSYEHSIDPGFSVSRLSLLDRGFIFAIAHVRGGGELGRSWYEGGKLTHKSNTFLDFIAAAQGLVDRNIADPRAIVGRGGSAGGLLMGAVATMAPELFTLIIAEVPFVDCLTTISDPELPLTITEWEEWGNPLQSREIYDLMASYSPYDNIRSDVKYPAMFLTAGLNDPRVSYWEPAKFVAKLRELNPETLVVLRTELDAGHMGPTGRYDVWRDEASILAFALQVAQNP